MEIVFEWGEKAGAKRLHWTPDIGGLIRLYHPVRDSDLDGLSSGVLSEDGEWRQIATFTKHDTDGMRAFFGAVDALR